MNLERFLRERQPAWEELQHLVERAGRKPERLGPDGILRLGSLYRQAAADLALARRRFPQDPARAHLEELTGRARSLVYHGEVRRGTLIAFLTTGYWQRIRERPLPMLAAALLLLVPLALATVWGLRDPAQAAGFVPGAFEAVTAERSGGADLGLGAEERALFSSTVSTNNIRVSFLAFAGGIFAGLGTAVVLAFNGMLIGVITGLSFGAGNGRVFTQLVAAHGVLELSCIVVTAAAGLRLGWALVEPGDRSRIGALVLEGRRSVELVAGTVPWLVLAGLVEGFITPGGYGLVPALVVGFGIGAVFWLLAWRRGRPPGDPAGAGVAAGPPARGTAAG